MVNNLRSFERSELERKSMQIKCISPSGEGPPLEYGWGVLVVPQLLGV